MKKGISMIETLRDFVARFNELGIEYMVTGSFAMSAYGEIRMTRDIDIVIHITENDIARLFNKFREDHYISDDSMQRAFDRKGMFNIVSLRHGGKIDCIIRKETPFGEVSFGRRFKSQVDGIEFWTTTKEDLILAKLNWAKDTNSEMQIRDIANLTSSEYDSNYVSKWIGLLGLNDIWNKVEEWKIRRDRTES